MIFIKDISWEEVFAGWRDRESHNEGWVNCATEVKGWPDWESWRRFSASQILADKRSWQIQKFDDSMEEIPAMLIGPYHGWQSRLPKSNTASFAELLDIPEQLAHFRQQEAVVSIGKKLPFSTQFIGVFREDVQKVVCFEGHHRATAIALAKREGTDIDFSSVEVTIALAHLPVNECHLLDEMLKRGSAKNTDSK